MGNNLLLLPAILLASIPQSVSSDLADSGALSIGHLEKLYGEARYEDCLKEAIAVLPKVTPGGPEEGAPPYDTGWLRPQLGRAYYLSGMCRSKLAELRGGPQLRKQYTIAYGELLLAVRLGERDGRVFLNLAIIEEFLGLVDQALDRLNLLLSTPTPGIRGACLLTKALCLLQRGEVVGSTQVLLESKAAFAGELNAFAENGAVLLELGLALRDAKKYPEALEALEWARQRGNDMSRAVTCQIYYSTGKYHASLEECNAVLGLSDTHAKAMANQMLARLAFDRDDFDAAMQLINSAVGLWDTPAFRIDRALYLVAAGELLAADGELSGVLQADPEPIAYGIQANIRCQLGQPELAREEAVLAMRKCEQSDRCRLAPPVISICKPRTKARALNGKKA